MGLIEDDLTVPLNLRPVPPDYFRGTDGRLYPLQLEDDPELDDEDASDDREDGDDPTYEDQDGIDWWWDGSQWNYWKDQDGNWVPFPGRPPAGLIENDATIPFNLRILPPGYLRASDGRLYPVDLASFPPNVVPRTRSSESTLVVTQSQLGRATNGMAIASMVLGILWLYWIGSILALIFGYIALRQIRNRNETGRGMAIAGVVLGWIGVGVLLVVVVLLIVAASSNGNSPSPY